MCMGAPMVVVESDEMSAVCQRGAETRRIRMALLGAQPPGTSVLVHLDTAIRVLTADEARLIDQALEGHAAALRGEPFEHYFAHVNPQAPILSELPAQPVVETASDRGPRRGPSEH